jgi:hypothetical protein
MCAGLQTDTPVVVQHNLRERNDFKNAQCVLNGSFPYSMRL